MCPECENHFIMLIEPNKPTQGLRAIAIFEAAKGAIGLAFAVGVVGLVFHHVFPWVRWLVEHFHFADAALAPRRAVQVLAHPENFPLKIILLIALAYTAVRFAEAYGLWLARRWGEWLTLIGATLYLPFEIYWITYGATLGKITLLVLNVALVVYLAVVLMKTRGKRARDERAAAAAAMAPQGGR